MVFLQKKKSENGIVQKIVLMQRHKLENAVFIVKNHAV